jgi:hypothetical protein
MIELSPAAAIRHFTPHITGDAFDHSAENADKKIVRPSR